MKAGESQRSGLYWWLHPGSIHISPPNLLPAGCRYPGEVVLPGRYSTRLKITLFLMFIKICLFLDPRSVVPLQCCSCLYSLNCLLRPQNVWGSSSLSHVWHGRTLLQPDARSVVRLSFPSLCPDGFMADEYVVLGHSRDNLQVPLEMLPHGSLQIWGRGARCGFLGKKGII